MYTLEKEKFIMLSSGDEGIRQIETQNVKTHEPIVQYKKTSVCLRRSFWSILESLTIKSQD